MKSVLLEAEQITEIDRQDAYGHPLDTYSRTAGLINEALKDKLLERLTAEDVITCLLLMKVAREIQAPGRDNRVDIAGYSKCLDMTRAERQRRRET